MALGHELRLVPLIYVKPFVKRQKNDTSDAEAITEAAQRPTMHFVAVKSEAQQAQGMLFRTRDLLVRQRTQTINALRGHLAEYGVVAPQGRARTAQLARVLKDRESALPEAVVELGTLLLGQIEGLDIELRASARADEEYGAADDNPGDRADYRDGTAGLRTADGGLPARAQLLSLARPRAATAHHRGQAEAGQDIEDGPARSQAALDHGSHGGRPTRDPARRNYGPVVGRDAGTQTEDAGRGGGRKQDGANGLDADHEKGGLPGSCCRLTSQEKERSESGYAVGKCGQDARTGKGKRSRRRDR